MKSGRPTQRVVSLREAAGPSGQSEQDMSDSGLVYPVQRWPAHPVCPSDTHTRQTSAQPRRVRATCTDRLDWHTALAGWGPSRQPCPWFPCVVRSRKLLQPLAEEYEVMR